MKRSLIMAGVAGVVLAVAAPAVASQPVGLAALNRLQVRAETSGREYERAAFGQPWRDVDHNGCSQRDDVLARDLTQVIKRGRCVVMSGRLIDPYTGRAVTFSKAKASAVQIDHVVALAEAWRSGASRWTPSQREAFANDVQVLAATSGPVNQAKSDKDAAEWTPIGAARRCAYARRVVTIKTRYTLSVDQAEKTRLAAFLRAC
jgi:hypothetical protein